MREYPGTTGLILNEPLLWEKGKKGRCGFSMPQRDIDSFPVNEELIGDPVVVGGLVAEAVRPHSESDALEHGQTWRCLERSILIEDVASAIEDRTRHRWVVGRLVAATDRLGPVGRKTRRREQRDRQHSNEQLAHDCLLPAPVARLKGHSPPSPLRDKHPTTILALQRESIFINMSGARRLKGVGAVRAASPPIRISCHTQERA